MQYKTKTKTRYNRGQSNIQIHVRETVGGKTDGPETDANKPDLG